MLGRREVLLLRLRQRLTELKLGFVFLTRLPLRHDAPVAKGDLAQSLWSAPLVGVVVALAGAIVFAVALALHVPLLPAAVLTVATTMVLTGALLYKLIALHYRSQQRKLNERDTYEAQLLQKDRENNRLGEIINKIHEVGFSFDGIIINAGAYTHTSIAIHDALGGIKTLAVEVHISNVYAREEFRHKSLITSKCVGMMTGFGMEGYALALEYFKNRNA